MSNTESFESALVTVHRYRLLSDKMCSRLQRAHDREMEELRKTYDLALAQARDPQRLRGTKPDTFDGAIEALREFRWQHATNDKDAIPYINGVAKAHAQSLKREYHRGFEDGRHFMDAEHRAIAMRLRALPLDGGSHENLSQIAMAIYHADFGWTLGACAALRDELVRLMGGVSDELSEPLKTINLNDEYNHFSKTGDGDDTCACAGGGACAADCGRDSGEQEVSDDGADGGACDADARGHAVGRDFHELGVSDGRTGDSCIRSHLLSSASRNDVCSCRDSGEQEESDGRYESLLDGSISGSLNPDWHRAGKDGILSDERLADDSAADFRGGSGSDVVHLDGLATYDVLGNERRKAIAELRKLDGCSPTAHNFRDALAASLNVPKDGAPFDDKELCHLICDRLVHLLGGDQPSGIDVLREMDVESDDDGTCPNDGPYASITDELRQCVETATKTYDDTAWHEMDGNEDEHTWCSVTVAELMGIADRIDQMAQANGTLGQPNGTCPDDVRTSSITEELREWASDRHCKGMSHTDVLNIGLIADRIDAQFDRICAQQEAVLQETIERMADENLTAKDERDHWKREASELQAKLDEYDRTHVELPRDANGKVFNIGCAVKPVKRDTKLAYTVSYMNLAKDGWRIGIWLDQYRLKYKPQTFEVCDAKPDPIEDTIEKLTLGEITQTEAIERIKSSHGTARRE